MRNTIFGLVIVWFCLVPESHAQISLETYVAGISQPTDIASAHDGSKRLFIVERNGRIRLVNAQGTLVNDPFLDITAKVDDSGGEEGLLGLVFHRITRQMVISLFTTFRRRMVSGKVY